MLSSYYVVEVSIWSEKEQIFLIFTEKREKKSLLKEIPNQKSAKNVALDSKLLGYQAKAKHIIYSTWTIVRLL